MASWVIFHVQGRLPSYLDPAMVVMLTDGRPVVYQDGKPVLVSMWLSGCNYIEDVC